jgi:periplasmic protein TonB
MTAGEGGLQRQSRIRLALLDEPWQRFPLVVIAAVLLWCLVLAGFGFLLRVGAPNPPPEALVAQIIELPANGLAGGGGGSPTAGGHPLTSTKPRQPPAVKPSRHRPRMARASTILPPRKNSIAAPEAKAPDIHIPAAPVVTGPPHSKPSSSVAAAGANKATGEGGAGQGIGTGFGNGVGPGSGTGSGGSFGSGATGPKAIYAPVPTIPDDMRDEVLEAVAVAHFRVLHDGRVTVSLAKPTDFSRLNDVILDTLREWRFHPAMNKGVAVDSEAEVRLLITVQ